MGLDMYVKGKRYLWSFGDSDAQTIEDVTGLFPELVGASRKVNEITAEFMYWRKANAIHKWFVDNVQGGKDECEEHSISLEQLAVLQQACASVLADPDNAQSYLPTASGFFFGGTDVDEWYMQNVNDTKDWIDKLFEDKEKFTKWELYYQSSW